jgi:hypothetical protein
MKRVTWTIEPEADVQSLVSKQLNRLAGRNGRRRGLRTRILNEAVRAYLAGLQGKRDA